MTDFSKKDKKFMVEHARMLNFLNELECFESETTEIVLNYMNERGKKYVA